MLQEFIEVVPSILESLSMPGNLPEFVTAVIKVSSTALKVELVEGSVDCFPVVIGVVFPEALKRGMGVLANGFCVLIPKAN